MEIRSTLAPERLLDVLNSPELEVISAVICIVQNRAGQVLMLLKTDSDPNSPGQWVLPGGCVNDGESKKDAASRELREETGLRFTINELHSEVCTLEEVAHLYKLFILSIFTVSETFDPDFHKIIISSEHTAVRWITIDDLLKENAARVVHNVPDELLAPRIS